MGSLGYHKTTQAIVKLLVFLEKLRERVIVTDNAYITLKTWSCTAGE